MKYLDHSKTLVREEERQYVLYLPSDELLNKARAIFPTAPIAPAKGGGWHMVVPYGLATCIRLSRIGYDVVGMEPFWTDRKPDLLEGKYEPMLHQLVTSAFMLSNPQSYVLNEMRTGKTGSTVMTCNYLSDIGVSGASLIIAPLSCLWGVWEDAFRLTRPNQKIQVIHDISSDKRRVALNKAADVYIINYDGVKLVGDQLRGMLKDRTITKVVIDELTHYGDMSTDRTKVIQRVLKGYTGYLWGMTGSPAGNPARVFGMASTVTPWTLPCKRQSSWDQMVYYKPLWAKEHWQRKIAASAGQIIYQTLHPHVRFEKKDVLHNLPEVMRSRRSCQMTAAQRKAYLGLKRDAAALIQASPTMDKLIVAEQKATLLHKLFQTAVGVVRDEDGLLYNLDFKPRVDLIEELIKEASQKTIIFGVYKGANRRLLAELQKRGYDFDLIDGDVSGPKRTEILRRFQNEASPAGLVLHPQTVAYGTELSAADMMIINGPLRTGAFQLAQMLERMSSLKQLASHIYIVEIYCMLEEALAYDNDMDGVGNAASINHLFSLLGQ